MKQLFAYSLLALFFIGIYHSAWAEKAPERKELHTTRIQHSIKIDGVLADAEWQAATPQTTHFTQQNPKNGEPSSQKTKVSVLYDDDYIYIGAMLYDNEPDKILRELGLRDDASRNTDWFSVVFDTYNKQQNGFTFGVTAAGVQVDAAISNNDFNDSWNAVWKSAVQLTDKGWAVEMQIPYASLRFPAQEVQTWGLNFGRKIQRYQEESYWNYVNINVNGFVTQCGTLHGLQAIKPPVRLQFFPFASSYLSQREAGSKQWSLRPAGGMDVKYGINEAFTLDMSLIPDFGQVLSDNRVLNIGPFEVQYNENRQFFTEGTELFNKGNVFYSRRIGQSRGIVTGKLKAGETLLENTMPSATPILNLTKISGRLGNGAGFGVLNGITNATFAKAQDSTGKMRDVQIDPFTNYNITVYDQNLKNNSSFSLLNANTSRHEMAGGNGNTTVGRMQLFDKKNTYMAFGQFNYSLISQKDGAGKISYTPGYKYVAQVGKVSGNWQFNLSRNVETDTYNPNDLGYLQAPNEVSHDVTVSWQKNTPFSKFNNIWIGSGFSHTKLYKPRNYNDASGWANISGQFRNFWGFSINYWRGFGEDDYFDPRTPGYFFRKAWSHSVDLSFSSDSRKKLFGAVGFGVWTRPLFNNQLDNWINPTIRYRFSNRFTVQYDAQYTKRRREIGFAHKEFNQETNEWRVFEGRRYIQTVVNTLSGSYTFNPYMGLSLRVRHYWSTVHYINFYDLNKDGSISASSYTGQDSLGNPLHNQAYNALNVDLVYSWQFAAGSFVNIVWKNSLYTFDRNTQRNWAENYRYMAESPAVNSLSVRVIYFLDYTTAKRALHKKAA